MLNVPGWVQTYIYMYEIQLHMVRLLQQGNAVVK